MTYTIISAKYSNPTNTAAEVLTEESAYVFFSESDTPDLWAELMDSGIAVDAFAAPVESYPTETIIPDAVTGLPMKVVIANGEVMIGGINDETPA